MVRHGRAYSQTVKGRPMNDKSINEVWKPVPGFHGYEASNHGRVRSLLCQTGPRPRPFVMRGSLNKQGRRQFCLKRLGKQNFLLVHRIVLLAFVGPCPDGLEGCHWDDDHSNNMLSNLRWDTRANNIKDRIRNGRQTWEKLDVDIVEQIRNERQAGESYSNLGAIYGVTPGSIRFACIGRTWKRANGPLEVL